MKNVKGKILMGSATSSLLATVVAVYGILTQNPNNLDSFFFTTAKCYQLSTCFGLLGMALFFVGWVYPKK